VLYPPETAGIDPDGLIWLMGKEPPTVAAAEGTLYWQELARGGGRLWRQNTAGTAAGWEIVPADLNLGEVEGDLLIDWTKATDQRLTLLDDTVLLAMRGLQIGGVYTLEVNTGAGALDVDWSDVTAAHATRYFTSDRAAPVMTQVAARIDIFTLRYRSPGALFVWASQNA
jgi:hypothetical protein